MHSWLCLPSGVEKWEGKETRDYTGQGFRVRKVRGRKARMGAADLSGRAARRWHNPGMTVNQHGDTQRPKTPSSYFQRHGNWELWAVTSTKLQPQNQVHPLMISKSTFLAIITTLCPQIFLKFYKQQIVKHDLVGTGCAIYLEHMLCLTPDSQRFFVLTGNILVSFHNLIPPNLHYS